ncbi:hypothetical protein JYT93_00550 [bacterium AH-315-J19]|nr:hypothetical protein [Robiginitomaculum sp.]MBN4058504.1 hypothetical protein [bacterium AH-315-J19]
MLKKKVLTTIAVKFCLSAAIFIPALLQTTLLSAHEPKFQILPNAKIHINPEYRNRITQSRKYVVLPDRANFLQTDKRWSYKTIGGSNETIENDGCLVTAVAMALVNLGYPTDPGDLTTRLKSNNGFNSRGWLVWDGIERATVGHAHAHFFHDKHDNLIRACMAQGYYPLVKFDLPSRNSTHWVMVVRETAQGFAVRDPLIKSARPVLLNTRTKNIDAVRCIGSRR